MILSAISDSSSPERINQGLWGGRWALEDG